MNNRRQYVMYMSFAIVAILINIGVQLLTREFLLFFFSPFALASLSFANSVFEYWFIFALGFGTLSGFVFKFIVDKFVVFEESTDSLADVEETGKQLSLYFMFAIFTTLIFWGMELSFKILFEGDWFLLGGILGLIIGYSIKFILDRKYVFQQQ